MDNNRKKSIVLFHPFSAKAIGLSESDLYYSHSKPHQLALQSLNNEFYNCEIQYFTNNFFPFSKKSETIIKRFFPVTKPFFWSKKAWRKEHSLWHFYHTKKKFADVTIINMSGHLSVYTHKIANVFKCNQKPYIAMVGGLNMSYDDKSHNYYKNANHVVVHTELQKKQILEQKKFDKLNIKVVPLGIDTTLFKPIDNERNNVFNLLFVGRITPLKQIELAIEAVIEIKKTTNSIVRLDVIGPKNDEQYFNELVTLIKKNNAGDYISFIGSVNNKNLVEYYQNASLLLLPSAHESYGIVVVEAMSCGTPTVALLNSGGPEELIKNNYNGILSEKEEYTERIFKLLNDADKLNKLKENCRKEVLKKYSLNVTKQKLKESIDYALAELEI